MAKSYNNLWAKVTDRDNIEAAVRAAARGKKKKRSVKAALANVDRTVDFIRSLLLNDLWTPPTERRGHWINDGIRMKRRLIIHPSFTEQVIHHLYIDNVISPIFSPSFIRWNCGTVPKRGQEEMAKHLMKFIRRHGDRAKYYVKLDIRKCFDTADTDAIYKVVSGRIRDAKVLRLTRMILASNKIRLPDGVVRSGGIPIGLYTSPWFVNIALDELDHYFTDGCGVAFYVRFMDDILMFHPNKRELMRFVSGADGWMRRFGFSWKAAPAARRNDEKVRFTGFQFDKPREKMCVRDQAFVRARRAGRRLVVKRRSGRRITAYDASRIISHNGRFAAFESGNAFYKFVTQGGELSLPALCRKVSERDKMKARSMQ